MAFRVEQIVDAPFSNDPDLFEQFYIRYREFVYAIALRVLGDVSDAEDVSQAIFLQLWQRPSSFEGGNLKGWLARITRNRCIDVLRGQARSVAASATSNVQCDPSELVEDHVLRVLEAHCIVTALLQLPEKQRAMIVESIWKGESHRRIANARQIPIGTVKTRIRDGLIRLRRSALSARL